MTQQFVIPAVGSVVSATVRMRHCSGDGTVDKTFTGTVVKNYPWTDDGLSFNVDDGNPDWPVHTVPIDWVVELKYADGTAANKAEVPTGVQTWEVDGSKPGTKYTVTKRGNKVTCSCPAFQFRRTCKHILVAK